MADLINTVVGEYRVLRLLGQGGMGEVYEALHPIIGKRVAVKVLKADLAENASQAQRFIEEARAVTAIHHPSIVDVFGFGTLPNGQLYLVMDLLEGESFHDYLREHAPLEPQEAMRWLIDLLDAVSAAHQAGVIHRDIKPSNLFLVGPPQRRALKVLDFGIARRSQRAEHLTQPNVLLGSPGYVAPEQIRGETHFATDLYAIGCMAWGMLTGQVLFKGAILDVLNRHLVEIPAAPSSIIPSIPPALDAFVLRLLAKDPAARPPSAAVARDDLRVISFTEERRPGSSSRPTVRLSPPVEPKTDAVAAVVADTGQQTVDERRAADVELIEEVSGSLVEEVSGSLVRPVTRSDRTPASSPRPRGFPWVLPAVFVALTVIGLGVFFATRPSAPPEVVTAPLPSTPPVVDPMPAVVDPIPPPIPPRGASSPIAVSPSRPEPAAVTPVPREPTRPTTPAPARPRALPSVKDLDTRLSRFEAAAKEGRARGGRNAVMLLEDARERLKGAPSGADRVDLQSFLDDWERRYLR